MFCNPAVYRAKKILSIVCLSLAPESFALQRWEEHNREGGRFTLLYPPPPPPCSPALYRLRYAGSTLGLDVLCVSCLPGFLPQESIT